VRAVAFGGAVAFDGAGRRTGELKPLISRRFRHDARLARPVQRCVPSGNTNPGKPKTAMTTCRIYSNHAERSRITLAHGSLMRVENGRGRELRVENGSVWITQSGSTEDVWLDAGQSWRIEHDGLTLVSAGHRTPFALVVLDPPVIPAATLGERLRRFWNAVCASQPRPRTSPI
jgi:Protein of unknown function (DUF2917)